jgi:hypothetical protein
VLGVGRIDRVKRDADIMEEVLHGGVQAVFDRDTSVQVTDFGIAPFPLGVVISAVQVRVVRDDEHEE